MLPTLTPEEIETVRVVLPFVGGAASALASVAFIINVKRRLCDWWQARCEARQAARTLALEAAKERVRWYIDARRQLVIDGGTEGKMSADDFHRMTIQEACAWLGDIPEWVTESRWARTRVGKLR